MHNMRSVCMPDILFDLHCEAALADVGIKPQIFNQLLFYNLSLLRCLDMKGMEEHVMNFVVLHVLFASRKSCTLSHGSDVGEKRDRKPSALLLPVIAGELGCLSMITYILPPVLTTPAALRIGLSDFHHPLPMFSLTPCIYNMLEQPLECKDLKEAISKHTHTHTLG